MSHGSRYETRRCLGSCGQYVLIIAAPCALELVEDAVILIQVAELAPQMIVDGDGLDRPRLHVDVPDLERKVVTGEDVATVMAELDGGDSLFVAL